MTYTVTAHGPHWLLTIGATVACFVSHDDAEREGRRLIERATHPPVAWLRSRLPAGTYPIPHDAPPAVCASCGAAIVWTRTAQGKAIPLSLATGRTVGGRRVALSHFADCEQGKEWSR